MPLPLLAIAGKALFGLFVVDVGLMAFTGKDVIEHVTGVDVWGSVWDFVFPESVSDMGAGGFDYGYVDAWGSHIYGLIELGFVLIGALLVIILFAVLTRNKKGVSK